MKDITVKNTELEKVQEIFGDDLDLFLFYVSWIKNGLNASDAYKELHPEVTDHSSRTLGSRMLAKVDKQLIMQAYGLDLHLYYQQLKDGLNAEKVDITGDKHPDHKTRLGYHDKLGKQLGVETDSPTVAVQVNIPILGELKAE